MAVVQRLERYPFPIAHPARALKVAGDPSDRLERAGHFVEMSAVTLGLFVLGWARSRAVSFDAADEWYQAMQTKGVALGTWIKVLQKGTKELAQHPNDPVARALHQATSTMTHGLDEFVRIRNTYAHGGRPRIRGEVDGAGRELTERASAILDRVAPLAGIRLGVVTGCGKRPNARLYDIDVDVMSGYAELFSRQRLRSPRPFDDGAVLVYLPNSLEFAVDLTPYCVRRRCGTCGRDELFYLTRRMRKDNSGQYFSFSTGHQLAIADTGTATTPPPVAQMGMTSMGSRPSAAAYRWRATWSDLAPRSRRLAARTLDTILVAVLAAVGWLAGALVGLPPLWEVIVAILFAAAYEPVLVLGGGTVGKRLLRIEPISTWDCKPLCRSDAIHRALVADLQLVPPIAVYNLAWLLWDPARQCLHDLVAGSIVVAGRSRTLQKR